MIAHNPAYEQAIRDTFSRQQAMATLSACLLHIAPGEVDIVLPFSPQFGQQDGFFHAGIITTVVDTACGCAAQTLMPADARVLTVEYKVNFLRPAVGEMMLCQGRVKKAGKTITVCEGEVIAVQDDEKKIVATMLATMITILPD